MRSCHVTVVRRPSKRSWCHLHLRTGQGGKVIAGVRVYVLLPAARLTAAHAATFLRSHDQGGSDPPPHALNVLVIRCPKLAAHLGFFKGDMNPVENGEDRDRRNEHWPSADQDGNAQSYGNEAEVHRIAAKPVRAVYHQFAVGT